MSGTPIRFQLPNLITSDCFSVLEPEYNDSNALIGAWAFSVSGEISRILELEMFPFFLFMFVSLKGKTARIEPATALSKISCPAVDAIVR